MPKETPESLIPESQRTLFVSGLSYETTEEELREFFGESGEIDKVNMPKYQDSNRNIGYCHITFETKEEAEEAMKLDGQYLGGRYLKMEWSKGAKTTNNREVDGSKVTSKTIFVKNLPYSTNEDEVGDFFSEAGEVKNVRLIYNSVHKHFKGFGYVDFKTLEGAKNAFKLQGTNFQGRPLYIDSDGKKAKAGYRARGDFGNHTKYNEKAVKKIRKRKEVDDARRKIKNFKPKFRKEGEYDAGYDTGYDGGEGEEEI